MQSKALAQLLKTIATERRIEILRILNSTKDPIPLTTIAALMNLDEGTTSWNLKALTDVGIVVRQPSGRWVFFSINRVVFKQLIRFWRIKNSGE